MGIRTEQIRQARQIHGSYWGMGLAALGVKLSRVPIPSKSLREKLWRKVYGAKYPAIDEAELEKPLRDFRSLNELFTRGVNHRLRPISQHPNVFICPCDSQIQDLGPIRDNLIMTVKGIEYILESLLPETDCSPYHNGRFGILFLSPRDCHRVFSPLDAKLERLTHVPGHRLLVHPPFQKQEFPVFTLNERILMHFTSERGRFVMVLVAGWGVGNITHPFQTGLRHHSHKATHFAWDKPRSIKRGEWVATFELGSTVIVLTEAQMQAEFLIETDQQLNYGEPLLKLPENESREVRG